MSMEANIRVLIADDHAVVREGLSALIARRDDMCVVGEAQDGHQAVALFQDLWPDIVLMDLRMPQMDGVDAITAILKTSSKARIIVLTTYDGEEDIYRGIQAGAKGYLLKDIGREELIEAIRAVYAGETYIPAEIGKRLAERIGKRDLTAREREVLNLIVEGKSNQEIGTALFITEGTVKAHVNSILNKLGVSDRAQATSVAIRRGIVTLK